MKKLQLDEADCLYGELKLVRSGPAVMIMNDMGGSKGCGTCCLSLHTVLRYVSILCV